jgi:mannan endo-1,4-beta-mannosidase
VSAQHRCAYTNWTTTATSCNDFFSDPNAIQLYKNHVRTMLTRVNTVTGIPYGNDPTIMGARYDPAIPPAAREKSVIFAPPPLAGAVIRSAGPQSA